MPEKEGPRTKLTRVHTEAEISLVNVKKRSAKRAAWIKTTFMAVGSISGLVFAFVALLRLENVTGAIAGFIMALVCSGIITYDQASKYLSSKISKGD